MAVAHVQSTSAHSFSPTTLTTNAFGSAVTTGNTIAVWVQWDVQTVTLNSVTDTPGGNTYTLVHNPTNGGAGRAAMAYALNVTGGSSFSVSANFSGTATGFAVIGASEISGVATTNALDVSALVYTPDAGTGTNAIPAGTSGDVTTTQDRDYIFGGGGEESPGDWTSTLSPGTNVAFTLRIDGGTNGWGVESFVQPSAGVIAAKWTQANGGSFADYFSGIMAFKEAATSSSVTPPIGAGVATGAAGLLDLGIKPPTTLRLT